MKKELTITVTGRQDGLPVKHILKDLGLSRREVSRLKFTGGITRDGEQIRITGTVHEGEEIQIVFPEKDTAHAVLLNGEIDILYEDEDLVIVNKPNGMPSHASHMHLCDDMGTLLANRYGNGFTVRSVGRLDKDVSGCMVYALSQPSASRLSAQRADGILKKTYTALVQGRFEEKSGTLTYTVRKIEGQRARAVNAGGQACITDYEVIEEGEDWSLLRITLGTGRSHQIRAGMAYYGHPLYGDTLYGGNRTLSFPALHCASVRLKQPFADEWIEQRAPLPEDFASLLEQLRGR